MQASLLKAADRSDLCSKSRISCNSLAMDVGILGRARSIACSRHSQQSLLSVSLHVSLLPDQIGTAVHYSRWLTAAQRCGVLGRCLCCGRAWSSGLSPFPGSSSDKARLLSHRVDFTRGRAASLLSLRFLWLRDRSRFPGVRSLACVPT